MKYGVTVFLVVVLLISSMWYLRESVICPTPLQYRLGTLDSQFDLTEEEAKAHIAAAEATWELATNRDLFVYDESATFTIDFVFDERQALADSEETNRTRLDDAQAQNEALRQTIADLQSEYDELASNFETRRTQYETDLSSYNDGVRQYNDQGGAPSDVHAQLEAERVALNTTASEISATANRLNDLATDLNRLSTEGNKRIASYNEQVNSYNDTFGFTREFTQGDYQGNNINIYKFSDDAELQRVLAHEFGHALGIGHVEGTSSVMYYLLQEPAQIPVLTGSDLTAFTTECGTGDELRYKVRAWLQSLFSN